MDWTDLQITVDVKHLETAAAVAQMTVPYGIQIEDYSDMDELVAEIAHTSLIDEALLARNKNEGILHIYIGADQNPGEAADFITRRLTREKIPHTVGTASLREEDWATAWKAHYHPTRIGQRLVVCPTWEDYAPGPGELVLRLDPGMAFGTGTHHTTRLCAQMLEEFMPPGCRVLDMGCGSGILSIAALLLGAKEAVGMDIDPMAVRTARENAALNGFGEDRFAALAGDLTRDPALGSSGGFDLIAANIVADVIIDLAPGFHDLLVPGGTLIASGIIAPRAGEVAAALEGEGMAVLITREEEGWCALVCRRT